MKRKIRLIVTFQAIYQGPEVIPFEFAETTEEIELVIPGLDTKFVVLPKVLEGVTDRVISNHNEQIATYFAKQREIERDKGQLALWNNVKVTPSKVQVFEPQAQEGDNDIELTPEEAKEVYEEFAP